MDPIILENATVLDVIQGKLLPNQRVVIAGNRITRVASMQAEALNTEGRQVFDVHGMTVMPGLCDAHVHVTSWTTNLAEIRHTSPAYSTARTIEILEGMLRRGFTTVRDEGGADYGLAQAVQEGCMAGPRLLFCGHALSPSGGHGDMRGRGEQIVESGNFSASLGRLCDGITEVRQACRDEIRKGAYHIKLMLSGGVTSPTDRLTNFQFSEEEIRAATEEAKMAGIYCSGHTYTAQAVNRALKYGVRSLEHCNLIDESSVRLFNRHNAFMVPTLSTYQALARESQSIGFSAEMNAKLQLVLDKGLQSLELAYTNGVKLVYGTDLLGKMHSDQLEEFKIRAEVQPSIDIIRSATCIAAELFNEVGETGVIAAGARADLLVVDGDPLADLGCLQEPERYLKAIVKDGKFFKNCLTSSTCVD
jgi:imidazolonepropionase-like amidohydrolase